MKQNVACQAPALTVHAPVWRVGTGTGKAAEEALARAIKVMQDGGVIIYPTETFYGLGCHPGLPSPIEKIYRIKGRDFRKPLPLIAADADAVRKVVAEWSDEAEKLARAFWPGPLTMVVPVKESALSSSRKSPCSMAFQRTLLSPMGQSHTRGIAVRVSSHPVAKALALGLGGFVVSTSANFSGKPPYTDPDEMPPELVVSVDGLLHGGTLTGRMPSTIVDVSLGPPRLVRAGCLSWEKIQAALRA